MSDREQWPGAWQWPRDRPDDHAATIDPRLLSSFADRTITGSQVLGFNQMPINDIHLLDFNIPAGDQDWEATASGRDVDSEQDPEISRSGAEDAAYNDDVHGGLVDLGEDQAMRIVDGIALDQAPQAIASNIGPESTETPNSANSPEDGTRDDRVLGEDSEDEDQLTVYAAPAQEDLQATASDIDEDTNHDSNDSDPSDVELKDDGAQEEVSEDEEKLTSHAAPAASAAHVPQVVHSSIAAPPDAPTFVPPGQNMPGFVPIGTAGVASAAQGNNKDLNTDVRVQIVVAERAAIPPLSYPRIWAKYQNWGLTQSRLRGMVYQAPGRVNAADTKRVKDPWTLEGVQALKAGVALYTGRRGKVGWEAVKRHVFQTTGRSYGLLLLKEKFAHLESLPVIPGRPNMNLLDAVRPVKRIREQKARENQQNEEEEEEEDDDDDDDDDDE